MSKVRFLSSALDGQTVTLTAEQGGVTRGPNTISVWKQPVDMGGPWAGPSPASLTVTVDEVKPVGDLFAPLGVEWRIRVTGTSYTTPDYNPEPVGPPYDPITQAQEDQIRLGWEAHDPSYQRCHFMVHTGETGNYRNTWVGHASHRNKAYQYGQNCGHVYSEPGTYTGRSIYVYDDEGRWGTLALDDLVVVNADTVFDAASTIVVDPDADVGVAGDWADAPGHLVANRFNTLDAASARFNSRKNNAATAKGMRICIKSGAAFTERARIFRAQDAKGPCLVDTYGGSARFSYSERDLDVAVTKVGGQDGYLFEVGQRGWAWRIKNGTFDMGYDVLNGRPTNASGWTSNENRAHSRGFLDFDQPALIYTTAKGGSDPAAKVVMDNLDVTGVGWFVINCQNNIDMKARGVALFLNDCEFYENADYIVLNIQALFALGTTLKNTEGSEIGGMGRGTLMGTSRGYRGHPIFLREQLAWTVYIRACYLESRGGWSGTGSDVGFRGGQQMIRANNRSESPTPLQPGGWVVGRGKRYFICDSVIMQYLNLDAPGDATTIGPDFAVIGGAHSILENCLLCFDPQSGARQLLTSIQARMSLRNNMLLVLDTPPQDFTNMPNRDGGRWATNDNKSGRFSRFITMSDNTFKDGNRFENRHNTFVMLRRDADLDETAFAVRIEGNNDTFTDENYEIVEGHNVTHAPNLSTPQGPAMTTLDLPAGMRVLNDYFKIIWERKEFTLASSVASGSETPAIEYPVDWFLDATTGSDYTGSAGNNSIETRFDPEIRWYEATNAQPNAGGVQTGAGTGHQDNITIIHDCNSSGVVQGDGTGTHFKIENRSGETWAAGNYSVILDRGFTAMTAEILSTVDQSEFKLYRPTTPQALDTDLDSTLFDFNRNLRPNAGYAISPSSGTNAAGAMLPPA